jgi:hypothetical protein
MKRIVIHILVLTALFCACDNSLIMIDDGEVMQSQLVLINRSSEQVKVVLTGDNWICPEDTITLKPERGLWKYTREEDFYFHMDTLEVIYGNHEPIVYNIYSDLPYNPLTFYDKGHVDLWDDLGRYQVIEFTDERRDAVFEYIKERKIFNMFTFGYPEDVLEQYTVPGSSETYFNMVFPVQRLHEDLALGVAVEKEAESVDKIKVRKDVQHSPQSVDLHTYEDWEMQYGYKSYYYLNILQKASLANFGCDFVELTGRSGQQMRKKSGVAATKVYIDRIDYMWDTEAPEDILAVTDDLAFINEIQYGNIMILLVESNEEPEYITSCLEYEHMYNKLLEIPAIDYYLLTLDKAGQFVCAATGKKALNAYWDGFNNPPIHPISISFTDFSGNTALIHVQDVKCN